VLLILPDSRDCVVAGYHVPEEASTNRYENKVSNKSRFGKSIWVFNIYDEFRRIGRRSPSLLRDGRSIADRALLFCGGTFRLVVDALKGSTSQGETFSGLWILLAASSH
jgi:hypothetical protein